MKELHLVIVSPERTVYDGKADSVVLPGELGEVRYVAGKETHSLEIKGGFVEVRDNQISVCAEL